MPIKLKGCVVSYLYKMLLCLLVLSYITSTQAQSTDACQAPSCYAFASDDAMYRLTLKPVGGAIPVNEYFDLDIEVLTSFGQELAFPIELEVDAGMPQHNHGMNVKPQIKALGNGHFRVEGMLWHMLGLWKVTVMVKRGVMHQRATVDIVI